MDTTLVGGMNMAQLSEREWTVLSALWESRSGGPGLARPRRQEILACLNRYRGLRL